MSEKNPGSLRKGSGHFRTSPQGSPRPCEAALSLSPGLQGTVIQEIPVFPASSLGSTVTPFYNGGSCWYLAQNGLVQ